MTLSDSKPVKTDRSMMPIWQCMSEFTYQSQSKESHTENTEGNDDTKNFATSSTWHPVTFSSGFTHLINWINFQLLWFSLTCCKPDQDVPFPVIFQKMLLKTNESNLPRTNQTNSGNQIDYNTEKQTTKACYCWWYAHNTT